jgi:hypothetical protein
MKCICTKLVLDKNKKIVFKENESYVYDKLLVRASDPVQGYIGYTSYDVSTGNGITVIRLNEEYFLNHFSFIEEHREKQIELLLQN